MSVHRYPHRMAPSCAAVRATLSTPNPYPYPYPYPYSYPHPYPYP